MSLQLQNERGRRVFVRLKIILPGGGRFGGLPRLLLFLDAHRRSPLRYLSSSRESRGDPLRSQAWLT